MQTDPLFVALPRSSPNGVSPTPQRHRYSRTLAPHEHAHLAQFLDAYLAEHHCNAVELAHQLTISANYLNAMKSARSLRIGQAPTYRIVSVMAARLGLPIEDLLGPPPPEPVPTQASHEEDATGLADPSQDPWGMLLGAVVKELRLMREMLERHLGVVPTSGTAPLDYLYLYWREVPIDARLRFLVDMLTPTERRALQVGFEEENI